MAILGALIVFLLVVGLGTYFVIAFNSLVTLRNNIDKAWANVDVVLKQRHDERVHPLQEVSWAFFSLRLFGSGDDCLFAFGRTFAVQVINLG